MTPARHWQVKQIFLEACDLEPQQAAAFLDQACGGDLELRKEVESLLDYHVSKTVVRTSPDDQDPAKIQPPVPQGVMLVDTALLDKIDGEVPRSERFPPGTVLAGRYRILGPLGRGGMGDVYRADDLKLDQAVALKFLCRSHTETPAWIARYRNEVRLARRVTHPNVVRVYDMSEADGEVFISMEYVDGEDLSSLLRRIGRPTGEKTIQIARQMCAGLGAAHDRGVLHRDLKPANVMIDGLGQVRITDFGIAALVSQTEQGCPMAGTPGFMAPELFQGVPPSIRSDLYSLGLVFYEMATGQMLLAGADSSGRDASSAPVQPSAIVSNLDAGLERAILQCLERDPKRRPESAYAIAAALPGGDPLAAALAANQTPSPSMVAAAGSHAAMRPRTAACWLATAAAALFLVVLLADRTFFLPQAGLVKPPAVLADKAQNIIATLAPAPAGQAHWQGFAIDRSYLEYAMDSKDRARVLENLPSGRPPAMCFWYRAGGDEIALPSLLGQTMPATVSPTGPGMVIIRLDGRGRLIQYEMTPDRTALPDAAAKPIDWTAPFELSGLAIDKFRTIQPVRQPPVYADSVAAWEGVSPENPEMPIRVEAASLGGRIVYYEVIPPWDRGPDWTDADEGPSRVPVRTPLLRLVLNLLGIIGGSFLAWHNVRRGRGDHRGAGKLVVFVLLLGLLDWLLGEGHVAVFGEEVARFYLWMARSALTAAIAWLCYFAVEPYVRRYWPQTMITWSRVLGGKFRDPLVGRDVLIGSTCGILLVLVLQLDIVLPAWLGLPPTMPKLPSVLYDLASLLGLRYKLGTLVATLMTSITLTLVVLLLMLVLRVAVRWPWLSMAAAWLLLAALQRASTGADATMPWLTSAIVAAAAMLLLVRVGLVSLIAGSFVFSLLINSPMTSDIRAWYAPASALAVLLAASLVVYGFVTARACKVYSG